MAALPSLETLKPSSVDADGSFVNPHAEILPPNSQSTDEGAEKSEKRKRADVDPETEVPPGESIEKGGGAVHGADNPSWKTSLCSFFRSSKGKCKHGEACRFAHGEGELRQRPDSTWDPTSERAKKMLKVSFGEGENAKYAGVSEASDVMMTEAVVDEDEPELTKCFVNLPMKWSSDNLRRFLGDQGFSYKSAKKKKGMGAGFVTFEKADQVKRAMQELDGKSVGNKNLKIVDVIPRLVEKKNQVGLSLSQRDQQSNPASDPESSNGIGESSKAAEDSLDGSAIRGRSVRDVVAPLSHLSYSDQLEQKKSNLMRTLKKLTKNARKACPDGVPLPEWIVNCREIGGLPCKFEGIVESPVVNGYRNKCEFSVGYSVQGKPTVGFLLGNFREGVTAVEEPVDCPNISRISCQYAAIFQEFLQHSTLPIWNRLNNTGFWRQLTVREGRILTKDGQDKNFQVMLMVQVCTVDYSDEIVNSELEKMAQAFALGASSSIPSLPLTALVVQDHKGISNAAPTDTPLRSLHIPKSDSADEHIATDDFEETRIYDHIDNLRFSISPTAFFQVNTLAAERLYKLAGDWAALGPGTLLFDICCGTGTIGLTLAHHVGMVVGIEMNASAVLDAKRNAEINGIKNCRFVCGKAEDVMGSLLKEYADLPQKGETQNCSEKNEEKNPEAEEGGNPMDDSSGSKEGSVPVVENSEDAPNCANNGSREAEIQLQVCSTTENGKALTGQFKHFVAIVDPPRVGLHTTVIKALRTHRLIRRLVYVSCNPESLVANAIELCTPCSDKVEKVNNNNNRRWRNMSSAGLARRRTKSMPNSEPFRPIKAMAVDLFPHTAHCELVLLLER